jgi:hypothetical protein
MSDTEVLRPAEAARRLGVRTRVIIEAMYYERIPRVRLPDGTLGIPADALDSFEIPAT